MEIDAINCALKMRAEFMKLLADFNIKYESELEIGIGTGKVVIGIFGHKSLESFDVFGAKVNEVAKIMHHRGIAVTHDVYEKIRHEFEFNKLADQPVKWSNQPVKIWEVI